MPQHAASTSAKVSYWAQQVRLGGHDVGLGELDGVLHPTFGCRVGGFAGQHRDAVVAAEGDRGAVADRDPGDVSGGDGLLVVGQQVGRGAADDAEDPVQSGEDTGCGPVPQRESRPGIGSTPTTPPDSTTLRPATIGPSAKSYCSHSPGSVIQGRCTRVLPSRHWDLISARARRVVRSVPVYPKRDSLFVGFVAADLSLRIGNPPLQDVAPIVDHPGPPSRRRQTGVAVFDRFLHGVVRAPAQLGGGAVGPGQVVGIEYFHEFSVRLQVGLSWGFRFD